MHILSRIAQKSLRTGLSRRDFLRVMGGAGVGLVIKVGVERPAAAQASGAAAILRAAGVETVDATGFIKIAPDNTVTVMIKHLEMGQGPYTGLATLVAEELDADWPQMRAEGAPANNELYKNLAFGMQGTGGSTAVANSYEQMRKAGATARALLVAAAAETWKVPAGEISVKRGVVRHEKSSREATFGQLADAAARQTPPKDVKLKNPKDFTLIGKKLGRVDSPAKSTGEAMFTIDMQRADALTVLVAHPPRFGAKPVAFDDAATRRVGGVVEVKMIPQGVAVYARGFWAARKGRDALRVQWNEDGTERRSSEELIAVYRANTGQPDVTATSRGNTAGAFKQAARVIEAEYVFPYLAHAPLEPMDCAIELKGGACEAWYGCQFPGIDHKVIADTLGLPPDKVRVNVLFAGGSFGRRAQPSGDIAAEAAAALKALGRDASIKLVWTREDDMRGGRYRPLVLHRVRAALDNAGNIAAWDHAVVGQSIIKGTPFEAMMTDGVDPTTVEGVSDLPYAVPNLRVTARTMDVGVPILWWRSVGHTHTAYAKETFIDELLAAAGKDALAGRLALLKNEPRQAGVLRAVARLAGWKGSKVGAQRARGVAVHKSFESYVAQIAEVSRGKDGLPKVERVWCAVDCGVAVNPDTIKAQMEGGIGFGLCAILYDEITLNEGRVVQANYNDYRMLRIGEMPRVDVTIVPSAEKPTGVGEPGVPPIGPAVANAWRVLTGERVRHLPFARKLAV
ncbi:MAG: molybdopterin cofactor-binding domain-containing protein [Burkholderiales bacterium]